MAENATYAALDQYIERLITESTPEYTVWNVEKIRQGAPAPSSAKVFACAVATCGPPRTAQLGQGLRIGAEESSNPRSTTLELCD